MLQRIQTIWILIALILMSIFPFMDYTNISGQVFDVNMSVFSTTISDTNSVLKDSPNIFFLLAPFVLNVVIILGLFVSIFVYKKRILQARLLTYAFIVILVLSCIIGYNIYYIFHYWADLIGGGYISISFYNSLPIISLILIYLAIRRIYYDEALVRAANRIR